MPKLILLFKLGTHTKIEEKFHHMPQEDINEMQQQQTATTYQLNRDRAERTCSPAATSCWE